MARKPKATVDYFPHQTEHGSTLFILENRWGNDGYAVWFKVLERLGASDGHFIDCRNKGVWHFLQAFTRVSEQILTDILDTLAELGKIDKALWCNKVIYSQRYVDGIADAYRRRVDALPTRAKVFFATGLAPTEFMPSEMNVNEQVDDIKEQTAVRSTEREREREREREIKEKEQLSASEVSDLYRKYAGVNQVNGGQVVVFQDFVKQFSRESIEDAFQAAAASNIPVKSFLNWCKTRMERTRDAPQPKTAADEGEKQLAYLKSLGY